MPKNEVELPVRLIIPAIGVNADIVPLGVTSEGSMEVPDNAVNVGWYSLGPRPGEKGSAVIAGHFDDKNGEMGVFVNLHNLKVGDRIYIEESGGERVMFKIIKSQIYSPGYAEEVFSSNQGIYLNLITCDGVWDGTKKSYSQRLVVFAEVVN